MLRTTQRYRRRKAATATITLALATLASLMLAGCPTRDEPENLALAAEHIAAAQAPRYVTHDHDATHRSPLAIPGNRVELLIDGPETYDAMFDAIAAATDHINLETFILADDAIGQRLADTLAERAAAGVVVNVIYDAVGSLGTDEGFLDDLEARGIQLLAYHPLLETEPMDLANRNHRKVLIIDGRTGFAGGLNFTNAYRFSSDAPVKDKRFGEGWRDTHVRIEGPAIAAMQRAFLRIWQDTAEGRPIPQADYFPELPPAGDQEVLIVTSFGDDDDGSRIVNHYIELIERARERVWITQAYFAPGGDVQDALESAARRGVDVRLLLPRKSDVDITVPAARSYYEDLLSAGVKIYEYQTGVLHAKTAVIDANWSTVGSSNLDAMSIEYNNELNAIVLDTDFADALAAVYEDDLAASRRIRYESWRERNAWERVKQRAARLLQPVL